ncbi:response regulator transcription factor [Porphyrobacter sp. AAP60]|uniref:response regulator transcription factor n=1 Tax=Porphyrobacter sp. AAP60 TaxID=1523423 RepID=UPI0006B9F90B|nr:LuxR C-terminal-related transcriptional regulator [Porphyrobacter sp. AAP60]KPF63305.1 LuxR family transcriptional regulator [Porphyrobacter sp. AAP60]
MENQNSAAPKLPLHLVEADARIRCEIANASAKIGHHCEPYAELAEIAAHAPREGIIIVRDPIDGESVSLVLERLLALGIWLPVVAFDIQPSPAKVVQAIKGGAIDYLSFPVQPERLAISIARISKEALAVSAARQRTVEARNRLSTLSNREMEVLEGLAGGSSNKAIARDLSISPRTVEIHRANMMTKLGVRHPAEVVRVKVDAMMGLAAQAA